MPCIPGCSNGLSDPLPALCADPMIDVVVSANLLSQLPILPLDRLKARVAADLGRRIVASHLRGRRTVNRVRAYRDRGASCQSAGLSRDAS
ncbi:hypothetical protein [Methylobacterium sp. sgz302541]|uniref:hypothetical protein n=1 Tax=unclassified Methylobacterium TaxID=2615210 RepID=UPI003D339110